MKLLALLVCLGLYAQEIVVIANPNMKQLTKGEIRGIFLKKIHIVNGIKVVPLNLDGSNPIRRAFQHHFLHMDFQQAQDYWMQQHYLGHRPPLSKHSQKSIKEFVKKIDGGIGYIEASELEDGLKVLYRWDNQL